MIETMSASSAAAFKKNARRRMDELGLTYRALGQRMGWSASAVHIYVSGKSVPGLDVLDLFAEALETSARDLIETADEKISA